MTVLQRYIYLIGWFFFRIVFTIFWQLRIYGVKNIPKNIGVIIASNHLSLSDPLILGCAIPNFIYYMGKKELFRNPLFAWLLKQVNTFPIDRTKSDIKAIRTTLKLLSEKKIVAMFPQGKRSKDIDENSVLKSGIGMLSCISQSPIIPCLISNSNKLNKFSKISIEFGEPIYPPEKFNHDTYTILTSRILVAINKMKNNKKNYLP
jgi:1-acyl-sn-glycerol-3-phosphate acyltransferase